MPLSLVSLTSSMVSVFASMPGTPSAAADALAAAYYGYAQGAEFGGSFPTLTTAHRDAMAVTLRAAISVPELGTPVNFSGAWAASVATFWIGVPVVGILTGSTTACPGASSLTGSLTLIFANLLNTPDTCAAGLAGALHTATLTTTAFCTPPPGGAPVPIA